MPTSTDPPPVASTSEPPPSPADRDTSAGASRRTRRRRWPLLLLAATVAVLVVVIAGGSILALAGVPVRRDLNDARRSLDAGRRKILEGDAAASQSSFAEAERRFGAAQHAATTGVGRVASSLPGLGRNMDVATGIAAAGVRLAGAGRDLAAAIEALPGGVDALAPTGGRLPLETLGGLGDDVADADAQARSALALIRATPSSLLIGQVADARFQAELELETVSRELDSSLAILRGLPGFAGSDGARRYLFVASNPAELRGTGGLWGAYAIVTLSEGRLSFGPFAPIESLRDLPPDDVPAPNPDFRRNYDQYGGAGYWLNMNLTPDFPSAARAALDTYRLGEGRRLDGVIAADPFVLQNLLRVTGPVVVPHLGVRVSAPDVVAFTTNQAYSLFGRSVVRKGVLGAVAAGAFERFLSTEGKGVPRLRALATAAAGGHLQVYSADAAMERGIQDAGFGGALATPSGDVASVVVDNASGTKVDYYASRSVSYDVQLGETGQAMSTTDVQIRNDAPTTGQPRYVIGPRAAATHAGDQVSIVTLWCAPGCSLAGATAAGSPTGLRVGSELGLPWYQDIATIPSGATYDLQVRTTTDGVWRGNSSGGTYRVSFLGQTTIRPSTVRISVHAPAGTRITWTSAPMQITGGTATWEGTPGPDLQLDLAFRAPLPLRLWRDVWRVIP
jgi:hypothetical protein